MNDKKFEISARTIARKMDEATDLVLAGTKNVNVGNMMISEFKAVTAFYRMQLDISRLTGKAIDTPIINMD